MKFCPTCQTRYDEEILRFCTKDGTTLIEEDQPNFTELPSESVADDLGDETVIRRNLPTSAAQTPPPEAKPPRIVIPTTQNKIQPPVRTQTTASYRQPPPPSNTGKIVLLTVLGTLIFLMGSGIVYLFLSREDASDSNQNQITNANFSPLGVNLNGNSNNANSSANFNFNVNANANTSANTNANTNLNLNANTRINANLRTPTPTRTATPTATATPNVINANTSNVNTATPSSTRPSASPPSSPPPPPPSPAATPPANRPMNVGVLNGRAVSMPKPAYPPIAKQMRASGQVAVQVSLDEGGNVLSARATTGNTLLRAPAEAAARQSRFNPVIIGDRAVRANGILVYNFINQ